MDNFIFVYNLILIILFATNIGAFWLIYRFFKRPIYLWLSLLFITFILDNTILYMSDFIELFSQNYDVMMVQSPIIKSIISIAMFICYRMVARFAFDAPLKKVDYLSLLIFSLALLSYPLFPFTNFTFLMYFTINQIAFFLLLYRFYPKIKINKQQQLVKFLFILLFILNFLTFLEDVVVIYNFDILTAMDTRIHQRNISEDLGSIVMAIAALFYLVQTTKNNFLKPFIPQTPDTQTMPFEEKMVLFSKKYQLTAREKDVTSLLLKDMKNQEMADTLFITLGTLKNHVHNIYQKCHISRRIQLITLFDEIDDEVSFDTTVKKSYH